jgi:hypothetical protein
VLAGIAFIVVIDLPYAVSVCGNSLSACHMNPAAATASRQALELAILGQKTPAEAMKDGDVRVFSNAKALSELWGLSVDVKAGIPQLSPLNGGAPLRRTISSR